MHLGAKHYHLAGPDGSIVFVEKVPFPCYYVPSEKLGKKPVGFCHCCSLINRVANYGEQV